MNPYAHALPSGGSAAPVQASAPNAALLIDFDNVTMGMRSDLSKDLKKLLQSDVIRGKVTVQRAYADWRRYPQYIVPLSENSIDLIYAPAYGSSKKNATDIRMAIDGIELVFTRPEIGVFILLTGDSDFSSLVLKLKEYGKYVIGVGIQESSSDILVQNCDEYYSYNSLAGLHKTSETSHKPSDPWALTERAVAKMVQRGDVMRSDRLKQVMIELDPTFNEGNFGFSKFSRFLTEAASKKIILIRKMENGQYEVGPSEESDHPVEQPSSDRKRSSRGRTGGSSGGDRRPRGKGAGPSADAQPESAEGSDPKANSDVGTAAENPLDQGYALLLRALDELSGRDVIRDSDVKRKMLHLDRGFDEGELGFAKFSRFLIQAEEDGKVTLTKSDNGNYQVARGQGAPSAEPVPVDKGKTVDSDPSAATPHPAGPTAADVVTLFEATERQNDEQEESARRRIGPRRGTTRRRSDDDAPILFAGQAVARPGEESESYASSEEPSRAGSSEVGFDPASLGLPSDPDAIKRYLSNSYKGVGVKTADQLVDQLGSDIFAVLHGDPRRVRDLLPANRAEALLESWREDYRRRTESGDAGSDDAPAAGRSRGTGRG